MNEEELNFQLSKWKVEVPDDPHFRSEVWREIAMRDANSPANRLRDALDRFLIPRFAIPAAGAAVAIVLLGASLHGVQSRQRAWDDLAVAYSSAIDPIFYSEELSLRPSGQ